MRMSCGFQRLRIEAPIGAYDSEKGHLQELFISIWMEYDATQAKKFEIVDDLSSAIDYALAADLIHKVAGERHHQLLEHLASRIAVALTETFPLISDYTIEIEKPSALQSTDFSFCKLSSQACPPLKDKL